MDRGGNVGSEGVRNDARNEVCAHGAFAAVNPKTFTAGNVESGDGGAAATPDPPRYTFTTPEKHRPVRARGGGTSSSGTRVRREAGSGGGQGSGESNSAGRRCVSGVSEGGVHSSSNMTCDTPEGGWGHSRGRQLTPAAFEGLYRMCRALVAECAARGDYAPAVAVAALSQSYYQMGEPRGGGSKAAATGAAATGAGAAGVGGASESASGEEDELVLPTRLPPPGRKEVLQVSLKSG